MRKLDKSAQRLAIELQGKTRTEAENYLVKYGASVAGAAAAVSMFIGVNGEIQNNLESRHTIAEAIETNC